MDYSFVELLHTIGQWLAVPCNVVLILLMVVTVVQTGHVGVELFFEIYRHGRVNSVSLIREMYGKSGEEKRQLIESSGLYQREKKLLTDLLDMEYMEDSLRQAVAQKLLAENEAYYGRILYITELVSKLGPMFGLLGTLIPLGPGIVALGVGDIQTLSSAMGMAFDTTIAGMISAAVCSVLSGMRRRWYTRNMGNMELLMEAIL